METASIILATLLASTILLQSSTAATTAHVVGGSTGWTIPPNNTFYSTWASSHPIASGDILVFQFATGMQNVVEVPKSSYDACSTAKQISSTINNGPATLTVTTGTHYYICTIPSHCIAGQKLAVTVAAAMGATTPSTPPTASKPAPAAAPATVNPAPPPTASKPAPAAAPVKPAPAVAPAAPKMSGPTASSPMATPEPAAAAPTPAPIMSSPTGSSPVGTPAMAPVAGSTMGSSPAPAAAMNPAASPSAGGSMPAMPGTTMPPTAPGPSVSGSGNGESSSPALRSAAGIMVALLAVATASLLV